MLGRLFRKFVAVLALLALLLPVASTLAGTITTAGVPVCCNTNYCPLHHSSRSNPQKGGPNCPGKNVPGPSSTIRACDSTPNPIVGTAAFVLATPVTLRAPVAIEAAYILPSHAVVSFVAIPSTPPPRTVQD